MSGHMSSRFLKIARLRARKKLPNVAESCSMQTPITPCHDVLRKGSFVFEFIAAPMCCVFCVRTRGEGRPGDSPLAAKQVA